MGVQKMESACNKHIQSQFIHRNLSIHLYNNTIYLEYQKYLQATQNLTTGLMNKQHYQMNLLMLEHLFF